MGASDSKLVFKQGIFKLSEQPDILADDPYWTSFWELPESTEDVFSLFSPADIRRTRDKALGNLETLTLAVASRLVILRNHPSFPDPELAPERDALNCIRILTRLLPFIYESDRLEAWSEKFFWAARRKRSRKDQIARTEVLFDGTNTDEDVTTEAPEFEEAKPLAEELIDTLTDLLFFSEFTVPKAQSGKDKVSYAIWQSGVGCNTALGTSKELENNRTEILRLLLTMAGESMYMSPNVLPVKGVKAITYMATCTDKQVVLSLLCSLLNTTLKYHPTSWRVPYDHVVFKDSKQTLSGSGVPPKNSYRHFLGRLHRPQDFQFIVDGMTRILSQPLQATSTYLPGSQKSLTWAPEMLMLFWEALQCNKRFRSFIIDTERAHDFVVLILFYAMENKTDPNKQGIIRMCVFILQTMSVEPNFGKSLNEKFESQETLPASIRIPNFHGTYADFLITSVLALITASNGKVDAIYPALLAIINNIAPYIQNLERATSNKLLDLFKSLSSPRFLLASETNHTLLLSLLEAMNAIIEHQYNKNAQFLRALLSKKKDFQALRDFTLESAHEEIDRQTRFRKEHAGETSSLTSPTRTSSIDSLRSPTATRVSSLSNVPEETGAFAIGDDDSDEDDMIRPTPSHSSAQSASTSRAASISSSVDNALPMQLRGMSEKARGKMPLGQPSFARQNSTASLSSMSAATLMMDGSFSPTPEWIESWLPELPLHTILTVLSQLPPHLPSQRPATDSMSTPPEAQHNDMDFHIVAPNIPGFGFSDRSTEEHFGPKATAAVFDRLMKKLGYSCYVVYGAGV
ncbi:hypothetical protein B0A49_01103 [Cryomyces minteri]|uniref:Uncharacterized protein n=1 Tax=Cryomyces minteri TaxID=331657 RepID=A0A4U0XTJ6_9PEZI|nr:hypothetical protein B0A49_01103 [Cryomyces minteri]